MTYAYRLAALKVASDLDLPELPPWDGPSVSAAEIVIRLGAVQARLAGADHVEPIFQTRGRDEYLLNLPGTGRMLVRHGREIIIETELGADPINTRALLIGPMQAVLWHQRGLLPLRGSAAVIGGRAVALAGPAATGKSALAAVLAQAGHQILADGICVVATDDRSGSPIVLPGVSALGLWRDTLDQFGIAANGFGRVLSGKDKFLVDCWSGCAEPRRLAAVVALARRSTTVLAIERLSGAAAFATFRKIVHMNRPAHALRRDGDIFAGVAQILSDGVTVWSLTLPDDPTCFGAAASKVLNALEQTR
jgi:hypothetical protein